MVSNATQQISKGTALVQDFGQMQDQLLANLLWGKYGNHFYGVPTEPKTAQFSQSHALTQKKQGGRFPSSHLVISIYRADRVKLAPAISDKLLFASVYFKLNHGSDAQLYINMEYKKLGKSD